MDVSIIGSHPIFGGTLLERTLGGSERSVRELTIDDARSYHKRHYTKGNIAVVLRGATDCSAIKKFIEPELSKFPSGPFVDRGHTP